MSRQNKVNPGQYTQRGRLTQDDAARELKRQRSTGSQHTWQPVQKDQKPRPTSQDEDPENGTATAQTAEAMRDERSTEAAQPNTRLNRRTDKQPAASSPKVKAKSPKSKAAASAGSKRTPGKAAGKTAKPAAKAAKAKTSKTTTTRRAVLARNTGGGGPKPRAATKRRKS